MIRAKSNMNARRLYSAAVDRSIGLICDQTIALNNFYAAKDYPAHLRRIRYRDPDTDTDTDTDKSLVFLTNLQTTQRYQHLESNDVSPKAVAILNRQNVERNRAKTKFV